MGDSVAAAAVHFVAESGLSDRLQRKLDARRTAGLRDPAEMTRAELERKRSLLNGAHRATSMMTAATSSLSGSTLEEDRDRLQFQIEQETARPLIQQPENPEREDESLEKQRDRLDLEIYGDSPRVPYRHISLVKRGGTLNVDALPVMAAPVFIASVIAARTLDLGLPGMIMILAVGVSVAVLAQAAASLRLMRHPLQLTGADIRELGGQLREIPATSSGADYATRIDTAYRALRESPAWRHEHGDAGVSIIARRRADGLEMVEDFARRKDALSDNREMWTDSAVASVSEDLSVLQSRLDAEVSWWEDSRRIAATSDAEQAFKPVSPPPTLPPIGPSG